MPIHSHRVNDSSGNPSPGGLTNVGAFFPIEVHVPPAIAALLDDQNMPVPAPFSGLALIDTGATLTCVHETLLARLGLNPIGVITSGTASGPVQQNVYPARIVFPPRGGPSTLPAWQV